MSGHATNRYCCNKHTCQFVMGWGVAVTFEKCIKSRDGEMAPRRSWSRLFRIAKFSRLIWPAPYGTVDDVLRRVRDGRRRSGGEASPLQRWSIRSPQLQRWSGCAVSQRPWASGRPTRARQMVFHVRQPTCAKPVCAFLHPPFLHPQVRG